MQCLNPWGVRLVFWLLFRNAQNLLAVAFPAQRRPPPPWNRINRSLALSPQIRDISMRYRGDLPPVLKGLNVSIKGGSRVGVVGRTGAGKSSLIAALFRMVELDADG